MAEPTAPATTRMVMTENELRILMSIILLCSHGIVLYHDRLACAAVEQKLMPVDLPAKRGVSGGAKVTGMAAGAVAITAIWTRAFAADLLQVASRWPSVRLLSLLFGGRNSRAPRSLRWCARRGVVGGGESSPRVWPKRRPGSPLSVSCLRRGARHARRTRYRRGRGRRAALRDRLRHHWARQNDPGVRAI